MSKQLLIVEKTSTPVAFEKSQNGDYILEGTFTEFGVRNNNNRVYHEKDFMQHVEKLRPKMNENKLLGELDHPAGFEISLKNVSHIIERLDFDSKTKTIVGRIKLLNTSAGKEAKALVDAGVPLHISSRAAGVVENDGSVKLKQLFTYDLVADPGFTNAKLKRINESFGFDDDLVAFYEMDSKFDDIFENSENLKKSKTIIDNNKNTNMSEFVTIDQLDAYTQNWKREYNSLRESVTSGNVNRDVNRKMERLEEMTTQLSATIQNLIKHNNHLVESINETETELSDLKANQKCLESYNDSTVFTAIKALEDGMEKLNSTVSKLVLHNDHIVEHVSKGQEYMDYFAKQVNDRFEHVDYLAEQLEKTVQYSNYLAEKLQNSIEYSENIAENLDKSIQYTENIAESLDKSIQYTEHVADSVNEHNSKMEKFVNYLGEQLENSILFSEQIAEHSQKTEKYANYLGENIDKNIQFTEHIAEETQKAQEYTKYVAKKVDENIQFTEHVAEETQKSQEYVKYVAQKVDENIQFTEHVAENTKQVQEYATYIAEGLNESNGYSNTNSKISKNFIDSIDSKLDSILESAVSKKQNELQRNQFMTMLLESQVNRLNNLDTKTRNEVINKFQNRAFASNRDAQAMFENILSGDENLEYIKNMPEKYKSTWNSLSESAKNVIKRQATLRLFETQDSIDKFWQTRDMFAEQRFGIINNSQMINESFEQNNQALDPKMESYKNELLRRFAKY
jgi:methyl-accepting chemotaxis protein